MSFAGRAASSSGYVGRPRGRETGLTGYAEPIQRSLPTGSSAMETAEHREPHESRGARTDLGPPGGERPPAAPATRFGSQEAAAAAAAHEVLVKLYPSSQATLDAQLQQALAQLPNRGKTDGIRIGNTVADRILALRNNDGSNAQPIPYVFGSASGDYQSTPPNFPKQPQFTHWSRVPPFALESRSQFRPGGPPRLTSDRYSDAFDQVKSLGIAGSTTASADEALTGRFWNGAIQNYWNEIAQIASLARNLTTAQNARLFALLNLSFADGVIAFYDAKYTYNFWRPVTAIRAAAS